MSCYCDADPPSAFTASHPKARKAHCCDECRGQIQPGELYHRYWGVWNGEQSTYRVCQDCEDVAKWYTSHVKCFGECRAFGTLHSDMYEDAMEHDDDAQGWLMEVAEKLDGIRAKRGSKVRFVAGAKELYDDRAADAADDAVHSTT